MPEDGVAERGQVNHAGAALPSSVRGGRLARCPFPREPASPLEAASRQLMPQGLVLPFSRHAPRNRIGIAWVDQQAGISNDLRQ